MLLTILPVKKMETPTLCLEFAVEPLAVQSARFFRAGKKIRSFQPEKVTDFKSFIRYAAKEQLPDNFSILDGPIALTADFVFTPPKSLSKKELKKIESGEIVYKITRPDLTDNLMKGVADALTGIVWVDDSRICEVKSRKRYGRTPGITLKISSCAVPLFSDL